MSSSSTSSSSTSSSSTSSSSTLSSLTSSSYSSPNDRESNGERSGSKSETSEKSEAKQTTSSTSGVDNSQGGLPTNDDEESRSKNDVMGSLNSSRSRNKSQKTTGELKLQTSKQVKKKKEKKTQLEREERDRRHNPRYTRFQKPRVQINSNIRADDDNNRDGVLADVVTDIEKYHLLLSSRDYKSLRKLLKGIFMCMREQTNSSLNPEKFKKSMFVNHIYAEHCLDLTHDAILYAYMLVVFEHYGWNSTKHTDEIKFSIVQCHPFINLQPKSLCNLYEFFEKIFAFEVELASETLISLANITKDFSLVMALRKVVSDEKKKEIDELLEVAKDWNISKVSENIITLYVALSVLKLMCIQTWGKLILHKYQSIGVDKEFLVQVMKYTSIIQLMKNSGHNLQDLGTLFVVDQYFYDNILLNELVPEKTDLPGINEKLKTNIVSRISVVPRDLTVQSIINQIMQHESLFMSTNMIMTKYYSIGSTTSETGKLQLYDILKNLNKGSTSTDNQIITGLGQKLILPDVVEYRNGGLSHRIRNNGTTTDTEGDIVTRTDFWGSNVWNSEFIQTIYGFNPASGARTLDILLCALSCVSTELEQKLLDAIERDFRIAIILDIATSSPYRLQEVYGLVKKQHSVRNAKYSKSSKLLGSGVSHNNNNNYNDESSSSPSTRKIYAHIPPWQQKQHAIMREKRLKFLNIYGPALYSKNTVAHDAIQLQTTATIYDKKKAQSSDNNAMNENIESDNTHGRSSWLSNDISQILNAKVGRASTTGFDFYMSQGKRHAYCFLTSISSNSNVHIQSMFDLIHFVQEKWNVVGELANDNPHHRSHTSKDDREADLDLGEIDSSRDTTLRVEGVEEDENHATKTKGILHKASKYLKGSAFHWYNDPRDISEYIPMCISVVKAVKFSNFSYLTDTDKKELFGKVSGDDDKPDVKKIANNYLDAQEIMNSLLQKGSESSNAVLTDLQQKYVNKKNAEQKERDELLAELERIKNEPQKQFSGWSKNRFLEIREPNKTATALLEDWNNKNMIIRASLGLEMPGTIGRFFYSSQNYNLGFNVFDDNFGNELSSRIRIRNPYSWVFYQMHLDILYARVFQLPKIELHKTNDLFYDHGSTTIGFNEKIAIFIFPTSQISEKNIDMTDDNLGINPSFDEMYVSRYIDHRIKPKPTASFLPCMTMKVHHKYVEDGNAEEKTEIHPNTVDGSVMMINSVTAEHYLLARHYIHNIYHKNKSITEMRSNMDEEVTKLSALICNELICFLCVCDTITLQYIHGRPMTTKEKGGEETSIYTNSDHDRFIHTIVIAFVLSIMHISPHITALCFQGKVTWKEIASKFSSDETNEVSNELKKIYTAQEIGIMEKYIEFISNISNRVSFTEDWEQKHEFDPFSVKSNDAGL